MPTANPDHGEPPVPDVGGPRRDGRRPTAFTPPSLACDAHCHVFGPAALFPFSPTRTYTPPDSTIDDFERLQSRLGLSRAVFVQASCHGADNRAMLDALARGGGRYAGVAMIDESFTGDDLAELHAAGVRGIRFNFVAHLGGAPDLDRFWRLVGPIEQLGWHVDLHFDAKDLPACTGLLDAMPVPYIIDHMGRVPAAGGVGQEPFRLLLARLGADERCWVKISCAERLTADKAACRHDGACRRDAACRRDGACRHDGACRQDAACRRDAACRHDVVPYHDVVPFARALVDVAADRLLWGTDWPHPNLAVMPDEADLVDLLADFVPDRGTRTMILVDNPTRLYDFSA